MSESAVTVVGCGSTPAVTVPQNNFNAGLKSAKYLRIALLDNPSKKGVFEVNLTPREGASGSEIYLLPGQLGLEFDESKNATASPATQWSYRRSQLRTRNGYLVLGTLVASLVATSIDGSLALGKAGVEWFLIDPSAIAALGAVSWCSKLVTAMLAFLLALWFKK